MITGGARTSQAALWVESFFYQSPHESPYHKLDSLVLFEDPEPAHSEFCFKQSTAFCCVLRVSRSGGHKGVPSGGA